MNTKQPATTLLITLLIGSLGMSYDLVNRAYDNGIEAGMQKVFTDNNGYMQLLEETKLNNEKLIDDQAKQITMLNGLCRAEPVCPMVDCIDISPFQEEIEELKEEIMLCRRDLSYYMP